MPFIPLPLVQVELGTPGAPAPPTQGTIVSGLFPPTPIANVPRPVEHYELSSFYLPVSVSALQRGVGSPPANCQMTVQLLRSGTIIFQQQLALAMAPTVGGPNWSIANGSANASLQNPVNYFSGDTLQLGYQLQFDEDVADGWIGLASIIPNPNVGTAFVPLAGSIGYSIVLDQLLIGETLTTP